MSADRDIPGVVAPPPLLFVGTVLLGIVLDWLVPARLWPEAAATTLRWAAGGLLFVLAAGLALWAERAFKAVGTEVRPWRPSTALAASGPYRFTRNPMYLGLLLGTIGIALGLDNPWLLGLVVPLALVLRYGVIAREEAYLERKFGDGYTTYKASVRRWL
ncbi:MAG: isoprenylcysteine carboxylmethyltransferase family protein [Geminicoccaceae bacterium]